MRRRCPHCSSDSIQIKEILFRNVRCPECRTVVGVQSAISALFSVVIFLVTAVTTFVVLVELGFYGALIWFSVPVGAMSYLRARFGPLEVKAGPAPPGRTSDA
jgi:uncharacterized protein (DUF983 family)